MMGTNRERQRLIRIGHHPESWRKVLKGTMTRVEYDDIAEERGKQIVANVEKIRRERGVDRDVSNRSNRTG